VPKRQERKNHIHNCARLSRKTVSHHPKASVNCDGSIRISWELHDETSQSLTSIIVALRVLSERMQRTAEREPILQIRDQVVTTLEAVHHLAVELRPMLLDDLGLVAAVQKYIENYSKQWRRIRYSHIGECPQR
jgi:signal transduction histidine kinase